MHGALSIHLYLLLLLLYVLCLLYQETRETVCSEAVARIGDGCYRFGWNVSVRDQL